MHDLSQFLTGWLDAGGNAIGEIAIRRVGAGFELRHREDAGRADLTAYDCAAAARELATYDAAGKFRPLKTAPNLRRGWKLALPDLDALRRALDYFYPAMLGLWCSHLRGELVPVPLRTTLTRQSGMYRVTQKISDAQAQEMIAGFCRSDCGCLKTILWQIELGKPVTSLPPEKFAIADANRSGAGAPPAPIEQPGQLLHFPAGGAPASLPLLCHEACNLLVANAREVVKRSQA
jgi:sirohydrochlorin cobaltochelatase